MKKTVNVGAYGWCHKNWLSGFYPGDLPIRGEDDWRLAYYSNEFNTVLVPADYWWLQDETVQAVSGEIWLDDINEKFQLFVECSVALLAHISFDEFAAQLKTLQPQLIGIVVLDTEEILPEVLQNQLCDLAKSFGIKLYSNTGCSDNKIWCPESPNGSNLAVIEDNLSDLRSLRTKVDQFMSDMAEAGQACAEATIIMKHSDLQAHDLGQCREMLEIMGY